MPSVAITENILVWFWSETMIAIHSSLADLEKLKLRLRVRCSVVVAVKFRQFLLDGRLVHFIQDRRRQVMLQPEIGLPVELRHRG